jgi:hypothetical protein
VEFINNKLSSLRATTTSKSPTRKHPTFLLHTPSYAYLPPSILQTFFSAVAPYTIHHVAQLLSSITHKQTEQPTHAFLAIVMEKFPLQECKKVLANENSKTKRNPKNLLCSH